LPRFRPTGLRPVTSMRMAPSLGKAVLLGLDTARVIPAMARGDVRGFARMGGNFALAAPDPSYAFSALARRR
jgi:hypothetical protein